MRELICIVCPKGCHLQVDDAMNVTGNGCARGIRYAIDEMTNPKRNLSSTVCIESKQIRRLPVTTSLDIPKSKMFEIMELLSHVYVKAPVKLHDVIIKNVLGLEADIIATRSVKE